MIVRVMEEDQYRLDDASDAEFERLDTALDDAVSQGDQIAYTEALGHLLTFVHAQGTRIPHIEVVPSDVVIPSEDMTLEEARQYRVTDQNA